MFSLTELGWSSFFEKQAEPNTPLIPARVAEESRELYHILCEQGEFLGELSGKLRHEIESRAGMPAVGDWVLAGLRPHEERATIHRVLERKGRFSRKMAGRKTEERIVAATSTSRSWLARLTANSICGASNATSPWPGTAARNQ